MAYRPTRSNDWGFPRWRGYGSGREAQAVRLCDRDGCDAPGDCPAPKSPNNPERWYFCRDHAAEYNRGWDYFQGLSAEEADNARGRAEGLAEAQGVEAAAEAERIRLVEGARAVAEQQRIAVYRDLPPAILLGLAAQQLAGKLDTIEHVSVTPDLLAAVMGEFRKVRPTVGGY